MIYPFKRIETVEDLRTAAWQKTLKDYADYLDREVLKNLKGRDE
jgi:hypothetical protein